MFNNKPYDNFTWDDVDFISGVHEDYLNQEAIIPINQIPELTYEIWSKSINHKGLSRKTKKTIKSSSPETLIDSYLDILYNSRIGIEINTEMRDEWYIVFDSSNMMYWKLKNDIDSTDCIIMSYWIDYIQDHSSTLFL